MFTLLIATSNCALVTPLSPRTKTASGGKRSAAPDLEAR